MGWLEISGKGMAVLVGVVLIIAAVTEPVIGLGWGLFGLILTVAGIVLG